MMMMAGTDAGTNKGSMNNTTHSGDDDGRSISSGGGSFDGSSSHLEVTQSRAGENDEAQRQLIEERKKLAQKEDVAVRKLRVVVFLVLLLATITCCILVYYYVSQDQKDDFEEGFATNAAKVVEAFHGSIERKLGAMDELSTAYTSFAKATEATFPNVTLPDFEIRGTIARILSGAHTIQYMPVITQETRYGWLEYVNANPWSYRALGSETMLRNFQDERFFGSLLEEEEEEAELEAASGGGGGSGSAGGPKTMPPIQNDITMFGNRVVPNTTTEEGQKFKLLLPVYQLSPVIPRLLLNDKYHHKTWKQPLTTVLETKRAVLAESRVFSDDQVSSLGQDKKQQEQQAEEIKQQQGSGRINPIQAINKMVELGQYRHKVQGGGSGGYSPGEPISNFVYPVFDSFGPNREVVGQIQAGIFWKLMFLDILPEGIDGIIVVVTNTLNQTFTYRLDGPETTYMGIGDKHDTDFDHMEVSQDVVEYLYNKASPETSSYTLAELDGDFCRYTIKVYPSQTSEDHYVTNEPLIVTALLAGVFLVTSFVFMVFNCMVERRQKVIMDRALASGAIVASLFPEEVKERLYEKNVEQEKAPNKDWKVGTKTDGISASNNLANGEQSGIAAEAEQQIADKFAASTVYFADIAGFTQWSSTREPGEVFLLLETLYAAFDKIALRRRVFKVETIGDCYMAATGLPKPQADHALIMTKFAQDCLVKFKTVVQDLKEKLGEDTVDLDLRTGLHSGPVTAGVLRGQRARFQLFGDTVNVASRMESNGVRGRIHISEATAKELIAKGKKDWLIEREDKVVAKGKGEMITFFVNPRAAGTTMTNTKSMDYISSAGSVDGLPSHFNNNNVEDQYDDELINITEA